MPAPETTSLIGGLGNDHLTGAAGDDMTAFTVPLGSTTPDDFGQWIDIAGADGSDRLFTIEHLQFPGRHRPRQ